MKAIILAAGKGERLRPLTDSRPKCMVKLNGKALIDYQLETLKRCGVNKVAVVSGYLREKLFRESVESFVNPAFDKTNMVYTLFCAEKFMCDREDLIIAYGDIVYDEEVLSSLLECSEDICVIIDKQWEKLWRLRMEDPLSDAETLKVKDGKIVELGKKPSSYSDIEGQYIGLIKVKSSCVSMLRETWREMDREAVYDGKDFENMYLTSFLQHLIESGWSVSPVEIQNKWLEVDTLEDLETYEKIIRTGSDIGGVLPLAVYS